MSSGGIENEDFEAVETAIEQYFGDVVVEVAVDTPVSQPMLLAVLAQIQLAVDDRRTTLVERASVVRDGSTETVYLIPSDVWETIATVQALSSVESRAAQEVHGRMAQYLGVERNRPQTEPLVYVHV